jgi:hypothetical protein
MKNSKFPLLVSHMEIVARRPWIRWTHCLKESEQKQCTMNRHEYKKSAEEKKEARTKNLVFSPISFWVLHICLYYYCYLIVMSHCLHVMFVNYMLKVPYNCHVCNCCLVENNSCKICGQPLNHNLVSVFHYFLLQKLTLHRCWGLNSNYFPGCFKFRLPLMQSQSCIALRLVSCEDLIEGLK